MSILRSLLKVKLKLEAVSYVMLAGFAYKVNWQLERIVTGELRLLLALQGRMSND